MKYILILICILFLSSSYKFENNKKGELIINGTISDEKRPIHTVYAMFLDGDKKEGIDSAKVINGKFKFKILTAATTLITLYKINPNADGAYKRENMLVFLSEPATVFISTSGLFSEALISGSKAYPEYKKLETIRESYSGQLGKLLENYSLNKAKNDSSKIERIQRNIDSVREALAQEYWSYIKASPFSPALTYAVYNFISQHKKFSESDIRELSEIYASLSPATKNSYYGQKLEKKLQSLTISVGMNAPAFVQNDTSGLPVSLESFKGKYVLLDFWASWCIPCRKANPDLVKAYNKYNDKGFRIVSVSLDKESDRSKWIEAIRKDKLTWTNLSDLKYWDNSVVKLYKVYAVPQNFLIDPTGKIIGKDLFDSELENSLKMLIK